MACFVGMPGNAVIFLRLVSGERSKCLLIFARSDGLEFTCLVFRSFHGEESVKNWDYF